MTEQLQAKKGERDGVRETKERSVQKMRHRGKQKRRHQRLWVVGWSVCMQGRGAASQDPKGS